MAIQELNYKHYIGPGVWGDWAWQGVSTFTDNQPLYNQNDYHSMMFNVPVDGVIEDIGFFVYSKTTGTVYYEVALKTLDGSGNPSTTNYGGSSGSVIALPDFDVGWNWIALSQPGTGTSGNVAAAVIKRLSSSNTVALSVNTERVGIMGLPRGRTIGSIAVTDRGHPIMAVRYNNDFVYGLPLSQFFSYLYDLNDNPDEVGAKFTIPIRSHVEGLLLNFYGDTNTSYYINLYDGSDDSILATTYVADSDSMYGFSSDAKGKTMFIFFDDEVWLEADQPYRLAIHSTSTTLRTRMCGAVFITGTYTYCLPEGDRWQLTYRQNSGSWTDIPSQVPYLALIGDQISYDSGGASTGTAGSASGSAVYGWAW